MANCPNCHAPLEEGAGFCGVCGTPVPKQVICSHCGQATAADGMFCERCGQPVGTATGVPETPAAADSVDQTPAAEEAAPAQVVCAHCGQVTSADGKFCERCGQPIG